MRGLHLPHDLEALGAAMVAFHHTASVAAVLVVVGIPLHVLVPSDGPHLVDTGASLRSGDIACVMPRVLKTCCGISITRICFIIVNPGSVLVRRQDVAHSADRGAVVVHPTLPLGRFRNMLSRVVEFKSVLPE
jgi:hypothetical protein